MRQTQEEEAAVLSAAAAVRAAMAIKVYISGNSGNKEVREIREGLEHCTSTTYY